LRSSTRLGLGAATLRERGGRDHLAGHRRIDQGIFEQAELELARDTRHGGIDARGRNRAGLHILDDPFRLGHAAELVDPGVHRLGIALRRGGSSTPRA
jgi:hypothetical protein